MDEPVVSLKRIPRALLRPRETFEGWLPGLRATAVVVALLCTLNGASVAFAGNVVTAEVDGSVTVDNPRHPPDWVCDGESNSDGWDCDASETIQKPLRPAASSAVGGAAVAAAFAPLVWVLLFAGLFVVVSGTAGGRDAEAANAFYEGAAVAAVAAIPGVLRYLLRPFAVERSLADWTYPRSLDGVGPAAIDALTPDGTLWAAVLVISGVWTAAVLYGATRAQFRDSNAAAGAVAVAALLTAVLSIPLSDGGLIDGSLGGLGIVLVLVAVPGLLWARTFISISKAFELIGFRGTDEVEPASWYVGLHRLIALCGIALGFVFAGGLAYV